MIFRILVAFTLALLLGIKGFNKKSLSLSGAIAGFIVGFISCSVSYRFGLSLFVFYYSGSKFTTFKQDIKAKLEDDFRIGGQRHAVQVLANSILATFVAILYFVYVREDDQLNFSSKGFSSVNFLQLFSISKSKLAAWLSCLYVAHYACAAGDTWASELGILSKSPPRLITKLLLVKVPPGTNGGMSTIGTVASAAGGASVGLAYYILLCFHPTSDEESVAQYPIILIGLLSGLLGSLFDSLLGGSLQATYYSKDRKCVVKSKELLQQHHLSFTKKPDNSIELICGYDVLSNEAVNAISILFTMIITVYISPAIFCYFDKNHC